jgi:hypothetical protein
VNVRSLYQPARSFATGHQPACSSCLTQSLAFSAPDSCAICPAIDSADRLGRSELYSGASQQVVEYARGRHGSWKTALSGHRGVETIEFESVNGTLESSAIEFTHWRATSEAAGQRRARRGQPRDQSPARRKPIRRRSTRSKAIRIHHLAQH